MGVHLMKKGFMILLGMLLVYLSVNGQEVSAQEDNPLQDEIIYHILVDRFNNGDHEIDDQVDVEDPLAYHGGDISGITKRLDSLKEIGVSTIVLSPIMANAPDGYHGYWIEDFYEIDEQFGTMDDFHELIEEAHDKDMKVVLEFVTSYVSETHPIASDPQREDWIMEQDETGPDWLENTVKLDQDHPEVQAFLTDVAEYWMNETDIDGFKLHAVDQASPEFLADFTEHIKTIDPNFYLLGDIFVTDEGTEQLLETTEMDAMDNPDMYETMTETFAEPDQPVSDIYETWENSDNKNGIMYLDNMYTKRFSQVFAENGRNHLTVWQLALTYMYTTPGIPSLFQGSEHAMYGENAEEAQRLVQFNSGDPELKEFHERISALRAQFPVLRYGDFEMVDSSEALSVFKRTYEGETMYIAINNSSESQYVPVTDLDSGLQLRGYLNDNIVRENENGEYRIGLPRESVEVYAVEPNQGLNWGLISFAGGILLLFVISIIYLSYKQRKREAE